jgi:cell division protein FtsB
MIEQERAPTQIENQIEEKSDILDTVRRFVLPGVTVALAVTTLWFAASSWRANSALQVTHGLIGDISAENAALEEQLELLNQSTDQVRAAQATLTNISNAVADNYNILEDLRSLENGDLSPEATSLIQFIVALISDNQTLIADSSSGDTGAKIRAQILADLLNALNSDEALENLDVLIPNIEVEALQNLARSILDLLRDADTEVQGAHLANDEMEQKISEQMERLSALSDALKNNALRDFIERYSGTVEAEIAAAAIKALVIQEPDSDPSATNGQSNN